MSNRLIYGDNLEVLKRLSSNHPKGLVDLVYIDPPFNSKRDYNVFFEDIDMKDVKAQKKAFADTWSNISYFETLNEIADLNLDVYNILRALDDASLPKGHVSYLTTIAIRVIYIHKILNKNGSFYLHCDPTMSHYLKIICDRIFSGSENFRNEIAWCYRGAGYPKKDFGRRHDIILRYCKGKEPIFNLDDVREEYAETTKKRFSHYIGNVRDGIDYGQQELNPLGKHPDDWWQIQPIAPSAKARLGYPTQKPLELLEKIILASSNEDSIVADFFCGCGTTLSAAQRLNRKWIGVDISHLAVNLVLKRLRTEYGQKVEKTIEITGFPQDIASAKELSKSEKGRLKFQDWVIEVLCGGVANPKKTGDGNIDGYKTFAVQDMHGKKVKEVVYIEVKSGNVTITDVRSFIQATINKSGISVFTCFEEQITDGMRGLAKKEGKYHFPSKMKSRYDRVQIVSIEELLEGKHIDMPESHVDTFRTSEYFSGEIASQLEIE